MKITEDYKVHISDVAMPEVWTEMYGARRKRVQPETVTIEWRREPGEGWFIWSLWLWGRHVHKQTGASLFDSYVEHGRLKKSLPHWLEGMIITPEGRIG